MQQPDTSTAATLPYQPTTKLSGHREITGTGSVVYGDSGEVARFMPEGVRFEPPVGANDSDYRPAIIWRDDWPIVLAGAVVLAICAGMMLFGLHGMGWL